MNGQEPSGEDPDETVWLHRLLFECNKSSSLHALKTFLYLCLACWVNISVDNFLKYFPYFPQKIELDISCKLSPRLNPVFWENKNDK